MAVTPEWLSALAASATAVGACLGGAAAFRGVNAWRAEVVGRRKTELAEEVLALFYRARDVLIWARLPADGSTGTPGMQLNPAAASAPVERLTLESQLFSELQASRYRFMAYFGEAGARPFDEIRAIHAEVVRSAENLVRDEGKSDNETLQDRDAWRRTIGWGDPAADPFVRRIDDVIRAIEHICRPLITQPERRVPIKLRPRKAPSRS